MPDHFEPNSRVQFLVHYTFAISALAYHFGVLAVESQNDRCTAYSTLKLGKVAKAIRHKLIILEKETESLLDRVPESVFLFTAPGNPCSCLPFSVFWQSSHKITRTQHTILTNMVTQFSEPSDTN